ncbi:MAG: PRC-barrel domain-containing protein [Verrucomicrobia bacterium]|nr:PRC-barrel domain-containing protein [Verrucomicrobiota bacterium]
MVFTAIAALGLTLSQGLMAVDDQETLAGREYPTTKTTDGQPAAFNKATGIIGMAVRNDQNERLGVIANVVFDLKSERVAYAVLGAKSGLFGLDEKLIAVPMNALTASPNGSYLILRAEKSKVAEAKGFDRDQWPSMATPSWGAEPFWQKDGDTPAIKPDFKDIPSAPKPGDDNPLDYDPDLG